MKTFRLMVGHALDIHREFRWTNRTFNGRSIEEAERKADKFFRDGKFSHMAWKLEEVLTDAEETVG